MKAWRKLMIAAVGSTALLAGACSQGQDGGDSDSSEESAGSAVAEQMRSWDACEVLDGLQPVRDYMQIAAVEDGELASNPYGSGMDQQALTCNGLVTVSTFTMATGTEMTNDGELWGGIIPWDTEAEAEESYVERTVDDQEAQAEQSSTWEELDRVDLGSEWDEGVLIVAKDEQSHSLNAIARDGEWMIQILIRYSNDLGREYYEANQDDLSGQSVEDFAYPFEDEALQQWLVSDYIPSVHQSITETIG
jgi:hypothetical protein